MGGWLLCCALLASLTAKLEVGETVISY